VRILLQKLPLGIERSNGVDDARGDARFFHLFGAWIEVFAFIGVDQFAESDIARVGVDASAAAGEDVVGVWGADGGGVSWGDLGAGWHVVVSDVGGADGG